MAPARWQRGSDSDSVYVLQRVSVVAGSDFRSADPGTDQNTGQRNVRFTLTNEAGDKFYDYTSKNVGTSMAVVMGDRVKEVANIQSAIRDSRRDRGSFSPDEVDDPLQDAAHRRAAGLAELSGRPHGGRVAGRGLDSARE